MSVLKLCLGPARRWLLPAALLACASCTTTEPPREAVILRDLGFASRTGEQIDGIDVAEGLNLDGVDSDRSDLASCARRDFVSPEGVPGVDNQFAFLYDAVVEFFQDGTVEGIVRGSINEGRLLIMLEVEGVDSYENDDSVMVSIFLGEGAPDVGVDELIVPAQTFDRRADAQVSTFPGRIEDGVLTAGPINTTIPMAFFNVFFDLDLHDGMLQAEVNDRGEWTGLLSGGVPAETILGVARRSDMLQEIQVGDIVESILPRYLDMGVNDEGRCTQLSAALKFGTARAFLFDEAPVSETDSESGE